MKDFYLRLEDIISEAIASLYPDAGISFFLETPRNKKFGDLSVSAALKLSSLVKRPPLKVAGDLKAKIEELLKKSDPGISKVEVAPPGFINFFIKDAALCQLLSDLLKQGEKFFKPKKKPKENIILEFVSANPTGPLSIAHGRQAVVGDVIANILKFLGRRVTREYYINDSGRQADLLAASTGHVVDGLDRLEDHYQAEYINDIAAKARAKGYSADSKELKEFSLKTCLSWIDDDLKKIGVTFDTWVSQDKDIIGKKKIDRALAFLKKKGFIYEKDNALWFSSTKFGDDKDRVVKKADGELTYFASDIAYHKDKIERGFSEIINLWGPDHHGYIPRVRAAIEALGFSASHLEVIIIQLVTIKSKGRMSKRKGTAVLLSELISEVGKDAARFYYLTRKNASHLEFDVDLAKARSFDNPLYYIQYAHARIASIIEKFSAELSPPEKLSLKDVSILDQEQEFSLIKDILQFRNILEIAGNQREPFVLVDYLGSLAASFHKFYEVLRVVDPKELKRSAGRLLLIKALKDTLKLGLSLLGVEAPEKM